jgi:transcription elongation factor Elf1
MYLKGGTKLKGQQIITCPNCGENKVKNVGPSGVYLTLAVITSILIVTLPLAIVFFILWAVTKKKDKYRFVCGDCKHGFTVTDDKLNEYKAKVN